MKNSKEYKICTVLFIAAIVLFCISMVTGLIPDLTYSIDRISKYLGFACFTLGLVYLKKSEKNNDNEDK